MPLENNNQKITCTISNAVSLTLSILLLFVYLFEERFFVLFCSILFRYYILPTFQKIPLIFNVPASETRSISLDKQNF